MATDSQVEKCSSNFTKSEGNLFRCWCGNTYAPGEKFRPHFNERDQRVRAEVLAAVLEDLRLVVYSPGWTPEQFFQAVEAYIKTVQPAAKALEELLRKAEVKGLRFALCAAHDEQVDEIIEEVINRRIAELEKPRAISEKL